LRAAQPLSTTLRPRAQRGHHWTALGLAFCAIASVGSAQAQGIWDDPAFALYRQAVEAMDKKDYARVTTLTGQAIAQQPTHVLAYYLRGQAAMFQSRWDDAVVAFGKVVELYPASFAGHRDLGGAYEQLNRVDDSAKEYEAALALRDQEDLRVRLAFMLLKANQSARALPQLQALADKDTKAPEVWSALARVAYEKNDLPAAEKNFSRAAALRDEGRTWYNLGVVRTRLNDLPGALQAFEKAAQHTDTREPAQKEIAKVREAMKQPTSGTPPERAMPGSVPGQPVPARR
ncbi:MAG TPA: tetratricopeptide repeat protein, partial [Methylomirabilota bacterium]